MVCVPVGKFQPTRLPPLSPAMPQGLPFSTRRLVVESSPNFTLAPLPCATSVRLDGSLARSIVAPLVSVWIFLSLPASQSSRAVMFADEEVEDPDEEGVAPVEP